MFASMTRLPRTVRAAVAAVALGCAVIPAGSAMAGGGFATQPATQSGPANPVEARFDTLLDRVVHLQRSAVEVVGRPIVVDRDNLPRVLQEVGARDRVEAMVVVRMMQHQQAVIELGCVEAGPACQRLMALANAITRLEDSYVAEFGSAIPVSDHAVIEVARRVNADRREYAFVERTLQLRESIEQWRSGAQVAEGTLG